MRVAEKANTLNADTTISILPSWVVEPVRGKAPYRKDWTKSNLDRCQCIEEFKSGTATGIGLKLGHGGLLAIDVDGTSAATLLGQLAGENTLQDFAKTIAWTSGREGRAQYLFFVPESERERIRTRKIKTGEIDSDGKEEALEFRWLGSQSVLPPSIHPDTQKPYRWIKSPIECEAAIAPEWLISLCENWHPEYAGDDNPDLVRFPARLYQFFRRPLAVWLLARRSDKSRKTHGVNKGCGIGSFHLSSAANLLGKDEATILGLLRDAVKSGLLRIYKKQGDLITCYYTSFERVFAIAGLKDIGPVAAINVEELSCLNIIATEIEAQNLQKLSLYKKQREEQSKDPGENPTQTVRPNDLLHPCELPARVLAKGDRFLYCESDFAFYGGSQEGIGQRRGISVSTVSRHLSNRYRLTPSPVHGYREGATPIVKAQLAERLPLLRGMPAKLCREDGLFFAHSDWFKPHCNIYLLNHRLISCRRRRAQISGLIDNDSLLFEAGSPRFLEDKNILCVLSFEGLKESSELDREVSAKNPLHKKLTGKIKSKIDHGSTVSQNKE
jgi:hypothetical protein